MGHKRKSSTDQKLAQTVKCLSADCVSRLQYPEYWTKNTKWSINNLVDHIGEHSPQTDWWDDEANLRRDILSELSILRGGCTGKGYLSDIEKLRQTMKSNKGQKIFQEHIAGEPFRLIVASARVEKSYERAGIKAKRAKLSVLATREASNEVRDMAIPEADVPHSSEETDDDIDADDAGPTAEDPVSSSTPFKGRRASTSYVTPCKPVVPRELCQFANDLDHLCEGWTLPMHKLVEDIRKVAVAHRKGDFPPLSIQVAEALTVNIRSSNWPRDSEHGAFAQYVLEHYVHIYHLTALGDVSFQNAERKFVVESISYTFFALERIFGVAETIWLERSSVTVQQAAFQPQQREVDSQTGKVTYVSHGKERWLDGEKGGANFDVLVRARGTIGDFVLVEISGSQLTLQHTLHPLEDAEKLDVQAKLLLKGRLMRHARIPGSQAKLMQVLTIQAIGGTLTVLGYHLQAPQEVAVTELMSFMVPMSKDHHHQAKLQLALGWFLKIRCEALKAVEQDMLAARPGVEGDTIRDWLF
ncbi:uncharacterized protein EV422DRAFT_542654 [Fimicolochytrium jonesii]|uniref:uncharacterized protein n=1 Tax=Fimicolochytrium jonesii TaxID=1396493 RepID=UPI0022FE5A7F|nr:uncharacterized protein EV422DRAFT_542654 [Fimicolochytrium jonesii]KAI8817158.1 hypothetical protein EV422DRAFT_542654 [Fimicolochytrium jonesii]